MHSLGVYDAAEWASGYTHEGNEGVLDASAQIRSLAISLHAAVAPGVPMAGVATKTLLQRISLRVHPDRYQRAGPRLYYIALASNTLI